MTNILVGMDQIDGSKPRLPEGILVYADTTRDPSDGRSVEGPLEYAVGDHGDLEPRIQGRPVVYDSIIVLTPGLVERELRIGLGGFGPDWAVLLDGDKLRFRSHSWGDAQEGEVTLTPATWERIVQSCNQLGIWAWERRYEPPPERWATDGPWWSAVIEANGKRVVSEGYRELPPTFEQFVDVLAEILGGVKLW